MKAEYADYMSFGVSFSLNFGTHVGETSLTLGKTFGRRPLFQRRRLVTPELQRRR